MRLRECGVVDWGLTNRHFVADVKSDSPAENVDSCDASQQDVAEMTLLSSSCDDYHQ